MNIFLFGIIIFIIIFVFLRWFSSTQTKKISRLFKVVILILSLLLALLFIVGGKALLSLPLLLISLAIVKLKGLSLWQLITLMRLLQVLRRNGRFTFSSKKPTNVTSSLSLDEAFRILNLDSRKKYTKEDIKKAHKKIISKIHPDISPETGRLAALCNEARDLIFTELFT